MAENLPLLPGKGGALCADVREVVQEVFRHSDSFPPLPAAALRAVDSGTSLAPTSNYWINDSSADYKKLCERELELQKEYAKRISNRPLPNIYKLQAPDIAQLDNLREKNEFGILQRKDLKPSIQQEAGGDKTLWVQNILNRSSGNLRELEVAEPRVNLPVTLESADEDTVQSLSLGELTPGPSPSPRPAAAPAVLPLCVVCIPPQLDFVNFTVGELYTQSIRLVNISKSELRVSVRPPARRELHVELRSRLQLTPGSAAALRVSFRADNARALADALVLRVSAGRPLRVPIACYMEPPVLHIVVPTETCPCVCTTARFRDERPGDTLDLGAVLLGEVHRVQFLLQCEAQHASFFLLCEDSWHDFCVKVSADSIRGAQSGGLATGCFYLWPARWAGGTTRAQAVCRAPAPGLHSAALRVLSSTAIVRSFNCVADALLFSPDHITLEADERNYDIRCDSDPACRYYANLGVAFPRRPLCSTIHIINNSPLVYNYYWSLRPWGVGSCLESCQRVPDDEGDYSDLCSEARPAKPDIPQVFSHLEPILATASGHAYHKHALSSRLNQYVNSSIGHRKSKKAHLAVGVSPAQGCACARARVSVRVRVRDASAALGAHRAVLMLILKSVPKESIPCDYDPVVVKTDVVEEQSVPGVSPKYSREVCDVVCAQLEVRWEVVPVRFALDPPMLVLPHSRRVKSVAISLRATQLYGAAGVRAQWEAPFPVPPPLTLTPMQPVLTTIEVPLELPNESPQSHLIRLVAEGKEWSSSCRLILRSDARRPSLRPPFTWLGARAPRAALDASLALINDTHENISWQGTCYHWCGPAAPCAFCAESCACAELQPAHGSTPHSHRTELHYRGAAPDREGCVATLVQTAPGVAALLASRVLAPRLVLRALACRADRGRECEGCALDPGRSALGGSALLRPREALTLGGRACCRARLFNITPIPTTVKWIPAIDGEEAIAVTIIPNECEIGAYATVDLLVWLCARRVCARRVSVCAARVAHAHQRLYLLIDAAVSGVEVTVEFPTGADEHTESFVTMRMSQKEMSIPKKSNKMLTPEEIFAEEDRKRERQKENICHCRYKMIYIPPSPPIAPPPPEVPLERSPVEIVEEPPPLTRLCECSGAGREKPLVPEHSEPYCLQFRNLPIRTVQSRALVLRNSSRLEARWQTAVRRWPRQHVRTADKEQWSHDVRAAGVVLQCAPSAGRLRARGSATVLVSVYSDTWGLYHDQILIQVENLEPMVIDVWIESVGAPLQFALHASRPHAALPAALWISHSDPDRVVRVTNTCRADLCTDVYILRDNEHAQDELPFRLYVQLVDAWSRACRCAATSTSDSNEYNVTADVPEESKSACSCGSERELVATGVELFLAPDWGVQDESSYQVEPRRLQIKSGATAAVTVRLRPQPQPQCQPQSHTLLLRSEPQPCYGLGWRRPPPALQHVRVRIAPRAPRLQASRCELRVMLCALDVPAGDALRVRKKLSVQNVGSGPLAARAATSAPWRVGRARVECAAHCAHPSATDTTNNLQLTLPAQSSTELFVEVSVAAEEAWPTPGTDYPPRSVTTTSLTFYDDDNILLLSIPLVLELDTPVLKLQPPTIDLGVVGDGSTREAYFTVTHSSPSRSIELVTGTEQCSAGRLRAEPPALRLPPRGAARVCVLYTARWPRGAAASGAVRVSARGAAGAWCGATLPVRARTSRCRARTDYALTDHY